MSISWQARLMMLYFKLQRRFNPHSGELDVEFERADLDSLLLSLSSKLDFEYQPVTFAHSPDEDPITAEWIIPPGADTQGVILYIHGGSFLFGAIHAYRYLVSRIAEASKARALNVAYRLAPEHPFPSGLEDAQLAYRWLLTNGVSPENIVIAGDSAGGNLTLALLLALRDAGIPLPAAAVCLSPATDLTFSGESIVANAKTDFILTTGMEMKAIQAYLGDADPRTPLASPLFADLSGLPPILIQVGSDEILLSDAKSFAEKARAAGVEVNLEVWDRMQHVWQAAVKYLPEARQAIERIGDYIQEKVPGKK